MASSAPRTGGDAFFQQYYCYRSSLRTTIEKRAPASSCGGSPSPLSPKIYSKPQRAVGRRSKNGRPPARVAARPILCRQKYIQSLNGLWGDG